MNNSIIGCYEKVDLFFSAVELPHIDTLSKTDAFAVLFIRGIKDRETLTKLHTTEVIIDNQNPIWASSFTIDYYFEQNQELIVRIYHSNKKDATSNETKHTFCGEAHFTIATVMRSATTKASYPLTLGRSKGRLEIRGEPRADTRDFFCATFSGDKLANKDGFFGTSDPQMILKRINEDGSFTVVWKSKMISNNLNPRWDPVKLPLTAVCNGDIGRPLLIEIVDVDSGGKNQSMGIVETSVKMMISLNGSPINVIEKDKQAKKKSYTNSGTFTASNCYIEHHPTFSQFIAGGCELNFMIAIDYTGSNGDMRDPSSLHFLNGTAMNSYQQAISRVGRVLEPYDNDKMYPVFGFGARLQHKGANELTGVQHCFPLGSLVGVGDQVHGIDAVLDLYKQTLPQIHFSGPTLFSEIIATASQLSQSANCSQEMQKYTVLLIVTDGIINDMEFTKHSLVQASESPLSVIIVGVGSADFSDMDQLDSDNGLLKHGNLTAKRDIVQFVSESSHVKKDGWMSLSQKVLAEIPTQLLSFMEMKGIKPNKKN